MSRTILYVDDEEPNRIVFDATFGEDFDVLLASGAAEALEVLAAREIAVVVTDQRMPGMSGNELLTSATSIRPETVRMVITAFEDVAEILAAVNSGLVARYFVKPWKEAELTEAFRWGLDAYHAGKEDLTLQLRLLQNERLAAMGLIAGELLHDLKQPLSYLTANIGWLKDMAPEVLGLAARADASEDSEVARREALFQSEYTVVVEDLLEGVESIGEIAGTYKELLSRSRPGDAVPTCALKLALSYAVRVNARVARAARVRFTWRGLEELGEARITSELVPMSRCFINLLENAVQANESGGRVELVVVSKGDEATITVQDSGMGMSEEVLERAGRTFFTTKSEGTGLGLAQAKRQIASAGGTLELQSELGVGTTVTVRLPTHPEAS